MKLRFLLLTLLLALPMFGTTLPAVQINFSLSLSLAPPDPCVPPDPCRVHGTLDFFETTGGNVNPITFLLKSATVPSLNPGDSFLISLIPPGPCFQADLCTITATFDGTFDTDLGSFSTMIFNSGDKLPDSAPTELPAVQIPSGGASGPLVTFDAPVSIGTWTAAIAPVPEPSSLAFVLVGLGAVLRRRSTSR